MGQPHPSGRAALRMLEQEGFALRPLHRHFRRRTDRHRANRPDPDDPRGAHRDGARDRRRRTGENAGRDRAVEAVSAPAARRVKKLPKKGHHDRPRSRRAARDRRRRRGRRWSRADAAREINFDGIVGPSHNYAGLSLGNLASAQQRRPCVGAARRGAPGPRQDARQPRARPRPGHFPAASAPQPRVARRAWRRHRGGRSGARRQRHVGLGDVGGQCRDGLARARHGRRQVPPDRRQSARPCRTAATNGPRRWRSCARVRRAMPSRCTRPSRPRSATRARPTTCGWRRRTASRASRFSSTACRAAPFRRASISKRPRRSRGCTGSIPSACSSPSSPKKRSRPAPSTTTSSRSPTSACCSRTSRPSPTRRRCSTRCEQLVPGFRICRGARRPKCRWPTRSDPICSTPSW